MATKFIRVGNTSEAVDGNYKRELHSVDVLSKVTGIPEQVIIEACNAGFIPFWSEGGKYYAELDEVQMNYDGPDEEEPKS